MALFLAIVSLGPIAGVIGALRSRSWRHFWTFLGVALVVLTALSIQVQGIFGVEYPPDDEPTYRP